MPRRITPLTISALPKGFPLRAAYSDENLAAWAQLSESNRLSVLLWGGARTPGELFMDNIVTQAREWVGDYPIPGRSVFDETMSYRDRLRAVRDTELARLRREAHNDGDTIAGYDREDQLIHVRLMPHSYITRLLDWNWALRWDNHPVHGPHWYLPGRAAENPLVYRPRRMQPNYRSVPLQYDEAPAAPGRSSPENREPSAHAHRVAEDELTSEQRSSLSNPLLRILAKGGRVWSAEVEIDHLSPRTAAAYLGIQAGSYSTRPDRPSVISASDSSVDAEIKISCMRDGAPGHQALAVRTYDDLRSYGALARENTGHHVHIDGTRLADHGRDAVLEALWASTRVATVTQAALRAICSSGFPGHRGYGGTSAFAREQNQLLSKGSALHGARCYAAANSNFESLQYAGATMEFRMPNGTLEPIRAHAYVALAMGLLDLGERAVIDGEPAAVAALRLANERLDHAAPFDQQLAAEFLRDHLTLSEESFAALAMTSFTSVTAEQSHRDIWVRRQSLILPSFFNSSDATDELNHNYNMEA